MGLSSHAILRVEVKEDQAAEIMERPSSIWGGDRRMPLARLREKTIITTLLCPRCEGVGRLIRKRLGEITSEGGRGEEEYFYTLCCLQCGEIDLWGKVGERSSGA